MWTDLLAFGQAFEDAGWTFDSEYAWRNVERLRLLESSLHQSNDPYKEVALVLNDGLARVYDLPDRADESSQFLWWLHSAISNHWLVNARDIERGNPGGRSVLTFGERISTWKEHRTMGEQILATGDVKKWADKQIAVYSPEEFQLNLAFSKAYLLDSFGSKHGLNGPAMYIDSLALSAIDAYLTSQGRHTGRVFRPVEGAGPPVDEFVLTDVWYRIDRTVIGDAMRFEIFKVSGNQDVQLMAIEFDALPVAVSHRGINAELFRVRRFNPLDEKLPFYFDFNAYESAQSPI